MYVAVAVGGRLDKARTRTDGYTVEFRVAEGEYAGRRLWMTKYLTPAALPYTKRDLSKLGLDSRAKLAVPFPAGRLVCRLTVALRRDDDGTERNEVRDLEVVWVQEPEADPYAPGDGTPDTGPATPDAGAGTPDFPFGANGGPQS